VSPLVFFSALHPPTVPLRSAQTPATSQPPSLPKDSQPVKIEDSWASLNVEEVVVNALHNRRVPAAVAYLMKRLGEVVSKNNTLSAHGGGTNFGAKRWWQTEEGVSAYIRSKAYQLAYRILASGLV